MWRKLSLSSPSSRQSSIAWPNQDRKAWRNTKRWLNCSKLTKKRTFFSMLRSMWTNRFWITQTMPILWIHSSNCSINKTASPIYTYGSKARTMIFKHSRQLSQSGMESVQKSKSSRKRTPTPRKQFRQPSVKKVSRNQESLEAWRKMLLNWRTSSAQGKWRLTIKWNCQICWLCIWVANALKSTKGTKWTFTRKFWQKM